MRRFLVVLSLASLATMSGCSWLLGTVDADFASSSATFAKEVLPEYKAYVDADASLDADDKRIRTGTADRWQALIDDANAKE